MAGVVLCKSHDVEIVLDAGSLFDCRQCFYRGGKENGGDGGKKGYINSAFYYLCIFWVVFDTAQNMARPSSCAAARHLMNEETRDMI
jgi:hypothetical protein